MLGAPSQRLKTLACGHMSYSHPNLPRVCPSGVIWHTWPPQNRLAPSILAPESPSSGTIKKARKSLDGRLQRNDRWFICGHYLWYMYIKVFCEVLAPSQRHRARQHCRSPAGFRRSDTVTRDKLCWLALTAHSGFKISKNSSKLTKKQYLLPDCDISTNFNQFYLNWRSLRFGRVPTTGHDGVVVTTSPVNQAARVRIP